MKNIKTTIVIIVLLGFQKVYSQQESNFSLYNFNMTLLNPAYAGTKESNGITVAYRSQWLGLPNGPKSMSATYSKALQNNLGIGVNVFNSEYSISNRTNVNVDVSYNVQLSAATKLYFAIKAGGSFLNVDYTKVVTPQPDPNFDEKVNSFNPQVGFGFYLQNQNYYINFSTPNFIKEKLNNRPNFIAEKANFYFGGGYHFKLNENFTLTPRVMMLILGSYKNQFDVGASLDMYKKFTLGSNYRVDQQITFYSLIDVFERLRVGFSYDVYTSDFSNVRTNGSIDFIAKYQF